MENCLLLLLSKSWAIFIFPVRNQLIEKFRKESITSPLICKYYLYLCIHLFMVYVWFSFYTFHLVSLICSVLACTKITLIYYSFKNKSPWIVSKMYPSYSSSLGISWWTLIAFPLYPIYLRIRLSSSRENSKWNFNCNLFTV